MSTALEQVAAAPYRDEKALERAHHAVRKLRALADAIEADPDLAPNSNLFTCYARFGHEREFFAAARRLFPDATPKVIDYGYVAVAGELNGELVQFQVRADAVGTKCTVTREVEEWVLDDEAAS